MGCQEEVPGRGAGKRCLEEEPGSGAGKRCRKEVPGISDPGASMQLGQLPNPNGYSVSLSKQFHCSLYTHYSPTRKYILRWITAYKWRQSRVHCSNYPIGDFMVYYRNMPEVLKVAHGEAGGFYYTVIYTEDNNLI